MAVSDPDALVRFFVIDDRKDDDLPPSYNVAPTDPVRAVAAHADRRYLVTFRWGLVPHWATTRGRAATMINARVETVASRPAYRDALQRRRCLIPADGFYEWRRADDCAKVPHFIHAPSREPLAFAGLWETWRDPSEPDAAPLRTCTIITRRAQGPVAQLHDRMPLALPVNAWQSWLDPSTAVARVGALLRSNPPVLTFHRVSPRVNAVRNNDADLIVPATDQPAGTLSL